MNIFEVKQDLEDCLNEKLPEHIDLLRQMVGTNSFTSNPNGVNAVGNLTIDAFAQLGFSAERVRSGNAFYGDHVVLTRNGHDPATASTIGLVSHLDTVYPADEERRNDFSWRVEGTRIYGPGTVDIKGGTVLIHLMLAALQRVAPEVFDRNNWIVLLNAAEEVLVPEFGELCISRLPSDTVACLVFEGGRIRKGNYSIVTARKGMARFRIEIQGKGSHAGSAHKRGANAVVQLSHTVTRIAELTNYSRSLTFNVGTVLGGTVPNRVPHSATASGEMRAFSSVVLEAGVADLLALQKDVVVSSKNGAYPCRINIEILNRWQPWSPNDASDRLLETWRAAAAFLGKKVSREERGGLSDGNFIWRHLPTLDGLGPSGGNAHCSERSADGSKDQEFVRTTSLVPKALLNSIAILRLLGIEY